MLRALSINIPTTKKAFEITHSSFNANTAVMAIYNANILLYLTKFAYFCAYLGTQPQSSQRGI